MDLNLITNIAECHIEAPHILLYSHYPAAIVALLLGIFVYIKNTKYLPAKILLFSFVSFSLWVVFDLITWINPHSGIIMFTWSIMNILEPLIFFSLLYFAYVYISKDDMSLKTKLFFILLLAPLFFLAPLDVNLVKFNIVSCESIQGDFINYVYFLDLFFSSLVITYLLISYRKTDKESRKQVFYLSFGLILFLLAFSWSNIFGNITTNWEITQYGLFGMPVFIAFLAYLIVKFQAFNVKLLGAQALVVALVILIGSQFAFINNPTNKILNGITLALSVVFGWFLIRSVKNEVRRKEELQLMSDKLARANDQLRKLDNAKSEFISIASHQLRTPLTAIKGFISLLLEGSYGAVETKIRDVLNKIYLSNERLIQLVEDLLNISRIESGRMEYKFVLGDIVKLVNDLQDTFMITAKNRGLSLTFAVPKEEIPPVEMDQAKIREVASNLIDNSLKYTQKGGVTVSVTQNGSAVRVIVSDTGIGIPKENLPYLFSKFSRGKDTSRLHAEGTGLGLYVGKNLVEMHHGKVWAESDGPNRGSRFIVELPLRQPVDK